MSPIDLPPNPLDALRSDLSRPAVVITATPYPTVNFCLNLDPERSERPRGGEPEIQLFRDGTSTNTLVAVVHETILDSASNAIIEGIKLVRQLHIRIPPADYST